MKNKKPLGKRCYGSIGHLPSSRLGPSDSSVPEGQGLICTEKTRDKHDLVIVQEKIDGSNVGVAKINGAIIPLTRSGYVANTSPHEQHRLFYCWAVLNERRFQTVLSEGERLCGEWIAQAHGTIYEVRYPTLPEPFLAFDIMRGDRRLPYLDFKYRLDGHFLTPHLLHMGGALSVDEAMKRHESQNYPSNGIEGVVYRVERKGIVEFLAKYVRPDKVDGQYLPGVSGARVIWNWRP